MAQFNTLKERYEQGRISIEMLKNYIKVGSITADEFEEIKVNIKLDNLCGVANETRNGVKMTFKDITGIQSHVAAIGEKPGHMDKRLNDLEDTVYNK